MKNETTDKRKRLKQILSKLEVGDYKRIISISGYSRSYIEKMFKLTPTRPINDLALVTAELIVEDRKASDRRIKKQIKIFLAKQFSKN